MKLEDVENLCEIFAFFWKNDPLRGNFQNYVPKGFTSSPIDVLCANFVKFGRREIAKVVRYSHENNSPALTSIRIAPKVCQSQLQTMYSECSRFHPNRFTFGGVIVERMNIVETRPKVLFPIFD